MKTVQFIPLILLLIAGCQTTQLNHSTAIQARSVNDVYYDQILSNIAMLHEHPAALPYFSTPQTGQNTVQCSLTLSYNPTWDLITSATSFAGRYLLDKQSATLTGADTNIEIWNTVPTIVPDRLLLMKYAYEVAAGNNEHYYYLQQVLDHYFLLSQARAKKTATERESTNELFRTKQLSKADYDTKIALLDFEERDQKNSLSAFAPPYSTMLYTGWYKIGTRWDVPKDTCSVAHHEKTYAWVLPGNETELAQFAIVILNLATYEAPDRQPLTLTPTTPKAAK